MSALWRLPPALSARDMTPISRRKIPPIWQSLSYVNPTSQAEGMAHYVGHHRERRGRSNHLNP